MKNHDTLSVQPLPKKAYKPPKLNVLGNVRKLTLKTGSDVDGFGASFG
jgi:hypothetical protein